jgi:hypothetical protein
VDFMSDRMARVVVSVLAFRGTGVLKLFAGVVTVALLAGVVIERWTAWELAGAHQALEARAFELVTRSMAPGSALACLDAAASSAFEEACEKALFASPESTAAAVSYVAAQLSILSAAKDYAQRVGVDVGTSLAQLRRNAEWDAFGIVAHILAARDGCTANQCQALATLSSPHRVRANLARRPFDANVSRYAAVWAAGRERSEIARLPEPAHTPEPVAASTGSAAVTPPRTPNNYFFPSAESIPAVSIMSAEPDSPPSAKDKAVPSAEATRKPPSRATASVKTSAPPSSSARVTAAPIPLAPAGQ